MESLKVLRARREKLDLEIAEAERQERASILARIKAMAEESGLELDEILAAKPTRQYKAATPKQTVKFRNPKDYSQTWSGRGRRPLWMGRGKTDVSQFAV